MEVIPGTKYYKFDNDELNLIRVIRSGTIHGIPKITIQDESGNFVVDPDILKDYNKLIPDAIINFSIVNNGDADDVIVTLHRESDLENNDSFPYAACRQNIFDLFSSQIIVDDNMYIGMSMSKDTCPKDVQFEIMIACDGLVRNKSVAAYRNDTLQDILQCVESLHYDEALENMYKGVIEDNKLIGYCKTLEELLTTNDFMYDFYKAFDIEPVDFVIKETKQDDDDDVLTYKQMLMIEDIIKCYTSNMLVTKYDHDIDLSRIQKDYIMVVDKANVVYVIVYDKLETKDEYKLHGNPYSREDRMREFKYKVNNV